MLIEKGPQTVPCQGLVRYSRPPAKGVNKGQVQNPVLENA